MNRDSLICESFFDSISGPSSASTTIVVPRLLVFEARSQQFLCLRLEILIQQSGILLSFVVLAGFFWDKEPKEITVAKFNEDGEFFQEVQCSPEHAKKDQVPE